MLNKEAEKHTQTHSHMQILLLIGLLIHIIDKTRKETTILFMSVSDRMLFLENDDKSDEKKQSTDSDGNVSLIQQAMFIRVRDDFPFTEATRRRDKQRQMDGQQDISAELTAMIFDFFKTMLPRPELLC